MVQECKDESESRTTCCELDELLEPRLFRALADPNRLTLLSRLAVSPSAQTVSELNSCCPIDLSVVSRHLGMLREAGIVRAEKRGREVHYTVCCGPLARILRGLAAALENCAANRCGEKGDSDASR